MEEFRTKDPPAPALRDPVRIDEVISSPDRKSLDGTIELPSGPGLEPTYSVLLQGWALGLQQAVESVWLSAGRGDVLEVPLRQRPDIAKAFPDLDWAGNSGFRVQMGVVNLPREFTLAVNVRFADGSWGNLGRIRGERRSFPWASVEGFQPILVTTIGRTGSTWLTWTLFQHPEVIAYQSWNYEPRIAIYFAEVLAALSQPFSYRQLVSGDMYGPDWWLGKERVLGDFMKDPEFDRWLGTTYVEELADLLLGRVEAVYQKVAELEGKTDARFFVEKNQPSSVLQEMLWDAFAGTREIFLVRDFRDVVCSILAFGRKRGVPSFGRQRASSDEEFVRGPLRTTLTELHKAWMRRAQDAYLLRYEDLIRRPHETVEALLSYIGVDSSPAAVERVVSGSKGETSEQQELHRTTANVEASIGRWESDLGPELKHACDEALGEYLDAFGYSR